MMRVNINTPNVERVPVIEVPYGKIFKHGDHYFLRVRENGNLTCTSWVGAIRLIKDPEIYTFSSSTEVTIIGDSTISLDK